MGGAVMRTYKRTRFQARHYDAIAYTISRLDRDFPNLKGKEQVIAAMTMLFRADNPSFKHEKFKEACYA
jgi:hypothetical protein